MKNFFSMAGGIGFDFLLKSIYFVIVANALGSKEYGVFAGILGLVTSLSPFVSWGSDAILVKNVSRDKSKFRLYWGSAVTMTLFSSVITTAIVTGITFFLFEQEQAYLISFFIALGDFLGLRLCSISGRAFQAFEKLEFNAIISIMISMFRLIASILMLRTGFGINVLSWSVFYMCSGLLAGMISFIMVSILLGSGKFGIHLHPRELIEGFYFVLDFSSQGVYNDIDKSLLLRLGGEVATGAYSASYRLVDFLSVPLRAIIASAYPRFFTKGQKGLVFSARYALRLIPFTVGFAMIGGGGVYFFRQYVPLLLGEDFHDVVAIIPWLIPVLFFRSIHFLAANALTGADLQKVRSFIQVFVALLNIILNLALIPKLGWFAAALASIICDGLLVVALWGIILSKTHLLRSSVTNGDVL
jgi:O-antigen/teichoic acid export membrane protein